MNELKFSIIFAIFVGFVVHKVTKMHTLDLVHDIQVENENLKIDMQYAQNEAYRDCQIMMQSNARIQKINGCYNAFEILCNEKAPKDFDKCMNIMLPTCERLD
jgi:hypothetical protein